MRKIILLAAVLGIAATAAPDLAVAASAYESSDILGVSCTSSTFCLAVGYGVSNGDDETPLAQVWDGSAWRRLNPKPAPVGHGTFTDGLGRFTAVSCATATSCVVIGTYDRASRSFSETFDGTRWGGVKRIAKPGAGTSFALVSVACASTDECLAVGSAVQLDDTTSLEARRWDGAAWTDVPPPIPSDATDSWLSSVSCVSTTFCTAAGGTTGTSNRAIGLRWDGTGWTVDTVFRGPNAATLVGVSCVDTTFCAGVGRLARNEFHQFATWNAGAWVVSDVTTTSTITAVSCSAATSCMAVGRSSSTYRGYATHWDGTTWTAIAFRDHADQGTLSAVSCPSDTWCMTVGHLGRRGVTATWSGGVRWTYERTTF